MLNTVNSGIITSTMLELLFETISLSYFASNIR